MVDGDLLLGPLMDGLLVTFEITAWSLPMAIAIGLVTALLRRSNSFAGRALATAYLELIRNTPILVQVYIFYFVLAPIFGLGGFWACVLALSFHEGSFTRRDLPRRDRIGRERAVGGERQPRPEPRRHLPPHRAAAGRAR